MKNLDLSNLSLKELQRLKKDWWEEAYRSGISQKLETIAKTFGSQRLLYDSVQYTYPHGRLHVEYTHCFAYGEISLIVTYKRKTVYSQNDKLFVPGDWTSVVDSLYDKVTDKERQDLIDQLSVCGDQ